jgi:23S rRNA (adenine2503-C2)-methyltransferase
MKISLKGLDASETEKWVLDMGIEAYRAAQIRQWLFKRLVGSFEEMTNLPKPLRQLFQERATINHLEIIEKQTSKDGTEKFLFELKDGNFIESVLIPEKDHTTLCISSQVGCGMNCRFCRTGKQGFKRDLSPSEIIEQIIKVKNDIGKPEKLTNIVFMGMGEPLSNYDSVIKALGNIVGDDGMNFSHRKITVSTCGLVPEIERMGKDVTVNLAVSLNASDDAVRNFLMPVNRKYPLKDLISACRKFPLPNRRMITFEYILIKGVNDRDRDAKRLSEILKNVRAKINLIPFNAFEEEDFEPPDMETILRFQDILLNRQYTAIIRKSKGRDILAACGQLSGLHQDNN